MMNPSMEAVPDLEKPLEVMEQSRTERQKILDGFLSRIADLKMPSISPETLKRVSRTSDYVFGTYKMAIEAFLGKTIGGGEKLTAGNRVMYSLISATGILFQSLSAHSVTSGSKVASIGAGASFLAHWALFGIQKFPELKQAAQAAQPEVQKFVNSMEKIVEEYGRARVEDMAREIDAYGY